MSTTKNKRKKVSVKINKVNKSSGGAFGIDLKSVMEQGEEEVLNERQIASNRAKERKSFKPSNNLGGDNKKFSRHFLAREDGSATKNVKARERQQAPVSKPGPRLNLYRKIAYSFIILTLALLAVIFYFSFIKVTITIIPKQERISNNLIIDIHDKNKEAEFGKASVLGIIERIEIKETKNYPASGREAAGEETTGKVTIINNYNKNQPLVATTRLLSPDNKLFRIKNTINSPAGGTVEVEVYADEPGPEMAIGPAKFTIPGLWAGLQDKIYAESKEPFKYNQNARKIIKQSDIDNGIKDIRKSLLLKAGKEVGEKYKKYSQKIYTIDENSVSIDVIGKVGEEKNEITITMTTAVAVAAFNDEQVKKMARDKLASVIASDKKLTELNESNISYSLDGHNLNQGVATINVSFEGMTTVKSGENIIDREKIRGLTSDQLNDFLDNEPKIESYEVSFSPAFIDKVPNLADRIKVKVLGN